MLGGVESFRKTLGRDPHPRGEKGLEVPGKPLQILLLKLLTQLWVPVSMDTGKRPGDMCVCARACVCV